MQIETKTTTDKTITIDSDEVIEIIREHLTKYYGVEWKLAFCKTNLLCSDDPYTNQEFYSFGGFTFTSSETS